MVLLHKDIDAAVQPARWNTATARNSIYNLHSAIAHFYIVRIAETQHAYKNGSQIVV